MRIGELSQRTGISTRMLRYYEEQGLLSAARASSGYRDYVESDVQRASTIGSLINSGLTTKLVAIVLSMSDRPEEWKPTCSEAFAEMLTHELTSIDDKIACLRRSRAAVRDYLGRVRVAA